MKLVMRPYCELLTELDAIDKALADLEVRKMLSGEMDNKNCYLTH